MEKKIRFGVTGQLKTSQFGSRSDDTDDRQVLRQTLREQAQEIASELQKKRWLQRVSRSG